MHRKGWGGASAALVAAWAFATPALAPPQKLEPLNQYVVKGGDTAKLGQLGYDLSEGGSAKGAAIVATRSDADALRAKGYTVTPLGKENKAAAAAPPDPFSDPTYGWNVFRPWHLK